jgi:hypothetical protein
MRFSLAWADVANQNVVLRLALMSLSGALVIALVVITAIASKDPLVIERQCYARTVSPQSAWSNTPGEIEGFIREAVSARFDSDSSLGNDYLALEELRNRDGEQTELKRRDIKQKIIVNSVSKSQSGILVDADRLLSVGAIRSAFSFPLSIQIQNQTRSANNPYGLVVVKFSQTKPGEEKPNEKK